MLKKYNELSKNNVLFNFFKLKSKLINEDYSIQQNAVTNRALSLLEHKQRSSSIQHQIHYETSRPCSFCLENHSTDDLID